VEFYKGLSLQNLLLEDTALPKKTSSPKKTSGTETLSPVATEIAMKELNP
jgi:hypothetical protein